MKIITIKEYMKYLLLFALLMSYNAKALETDSTAHLGTSFVLNTVAYGFLHKAVTMPRKDALIFSVFTTLSIGFTKEVMDCIERGDERFDGKDMLFNVLGTGLSTLTIVMFDF